MNIKVAIAALAVALCSAVQAGQPKWFVVPESPSAPVLEKGLGDPAWTKALKVPFAKLDEAPGDTAKFPVESYWLRSGSSLFVAFKCFNPASPKLFASEVKARDQALWARESVELFIGDMDAARYFQLVVDPQGNIFDARMNESSWDGPFKVWSELENGSWSFVVEIPDQALAACFKPGAFISVGMLRHGFNADGTGHESVSLSQPASHSPSDRFLLGTPNPKALGERARAEIAFFKKSRAESSLSADAKARLAGLEAFADECESAGDVSLERFKGFYERYAKLKRALVEIERDSVISALFSKED